MTTSIATIEQQIIDGIDAADMETIRSIQYRPGGILPSEMLAFVAACRIQDVTHVVESGRKHGYSTECIIRCLPEAALLSFDKNVVAEADHRLQGVAAQCGADIDLRAGDFWKHSAVDWQGRRTAVLIDGPKDVDALICAEQFRSSAAVIAIHDMSLYYEVSGHGAQQRVARQYAEEMPGSWFTDCEDYTQRYEHLDRVAWEFPGSGYRLRHEMTQCNFTLGLFPGERWRQVPRGAVEQSSKDWQLP